MKVGLGTRLALWFAFLAALTALVTAAVSSYSTNQRINDDIDQFLVDRAAEIAEGRRSDRPRRGQIGRNRSSDFDTANEQINEVLDLVDSDAEVQILDRSGGVLISAGASLPFAEVDERFLERSEVPLLRTVTIGDEQYRMITSHVEDGGLVQVARSLSSSSALLRALRTRLILVGIVMSGVAGLVGSMIASRTTQPLRRLTRSVESIAATQDLSARVALDRNDEIGRLSERFDEVLRTLDSSRDQQQQLIQDAAHELRTPLTSVRANIDFLARAHDADVDTRDAVLASIRAELAELGEVLAEVVDLATESRGEASFGEVDLSLVAESAMAQFALRSNRPVVRELASSVVQGDEGALLRAASNLISNADKYSPEGLPITVGVSAGSFWVSDQGPGIQPRERERVFDRFHRLDRDRSAAGSGLGLAIVAKIANEHGGNAWASESPSGGAKVGFTLHP